MAIFSFSTVRIALENLGFEMQVSDESNEIVWFTHNKQGASVIIGFDEMTETYVKERMNRIQLPYEYFKSLTIKMRDLKKK